MCAYIIFYKPVVRMIVYCIYTPSGKVGRFMGILCEETQGV